MLPRASSSAVGTSLIGWILAFNSCTDEIRPDDIDAVNAEAGSSGEKYPEEYPRLTDDYTSDCSGLTQRMRDCGLLSDGAFHCSEPDSVTDVCAFECYSIASCAILEEMQCKGTAARALEDCLVQCSIFTCGSGERLPQFWVCDRDPDCADGSDEADCFQCDSGGVLPTEARCDANQDCADGSDEAGCDAFACDSGEKIPVPYRCDLEADCDDASDEVDCDFFVCEATQEPIFSRWHCDGEEDCLDGSDEFGCARFLCP
jgi:hypothetical protein